MSMKNKNKNKPDLSSKKKKNVVKICLTAGIVVSVATAIVSLVAWGRPVVVPEKKVVKEMDPVVRTRYLASNDFARLDDQQKRQVMEDMRSGTSFRRGMSGMRNISDGERDKIRKNTRQVMDAMMKERLDNFFAMSQDDRNKELDKWIDRMERFRAARPDGAAGGTAAPAGNRRDRRSQAGLGQRMSRRLEETDSDTRARMSEFFKQMRARREQRSKQ